MRRFRREPWRFLGDLVALVVFLGLISVAFWAVIKWTSLDLVEMIALSFCALLAVGSIVAGLFEWWFEREDPSDGGSKSREWFRAWFAGPRE